MTLPPGSLRDPWQAGATRRAFLVGTANATVSAGVFAGLILPSGCAAPAPEPEPIDPAGLVFPPPPEQPRFYYDRTIWGSTDVVEDTQKGRLRRFATGESRRGQGFAKPFALAVQGGRLYVSDTVSRSVHMLDFPAKEYKRIGNTGVGRLSKPLGLDLDASGRLYVVDGSASRVNVYDPDGNYLKALGVSADLDRPTAVAVSPSGDRAYVLDTGGVRSEKHRVLILDSSGETIGTIGTRGTGPGEFNLPLDIDLGPDGRIYVLDSGNFRVQVFSPDGELVQAFGEAGRFPGQFGHPKGIAVDDEGKIFISDTSFGVFQIFNDQGQMLMSVGERSETGGAAKFLLPAGLDVDVDGRIYMVDQFFQKIDAFRPAELPEDWPVGQAVA